MHCCQQALTWHILFSMKKPPVILASTSAYRAAQLKQLGLTFEQRAPLFDEDSYKAKERNPRKLAELLAFEKAQSIGSEIDNQSLGSETAHQSIIIGGDQLISLDGEVLGKSGSEAEALSQLRKMRGKVHELVSAICVIRGEQVLRHTEIAKMHMRQLSDEQLSWYIEKDQPFDCAGSYKLEAHGIALFDEIKCADFSAITGVPLLKLSQLLIELGHPVP